MQEKSERAVAKARKQIADVIGAKTEEIYFTGGGSESDNWAFKATAEAYSSKGKHIITIHDRASCDPAYCTVAGDCRDYEVTYVDVDENGKVKLDELKAAIRPDTILISVMAANNEIGTIRATEGNRCDRKETRGSVPYRCGTGFCPCADQCR